MYCNKRARYNVEENEGGMTFERSQSLPSPGKLRAVPVDVSTVENFLTYWWGEENLQEPKVLRGAASTTYQYKVDIVESDGEKWTLFFNFFQNTGQISLQGKKCVFNGPAIKREFLTVLKTAKDLGILSPEVVEKWTEHIQNF